MPRRKPLAAAFARPRCCYYGDVADQSILAESKDELLIVHLPTAQVFKP